MYMNQCLKMSTTFYIPIIVSGINLGASATSIGLLLISTTVLALFWKNNLNNVGTRTNYNIQGISKLEPLYSIN